MPWGAVSDIDEAGVASAYHVTDDPEGLVAFLASERPLDLPRSARDWYAELGPGLYVSGQAQVWVGRSGVKWGFLERLAPEELQALAAALRARLGEDRRTHYITENEHGRAHRTIELAESGFTSPTVLIALAGQPYNIALWKRAFLEPLGISPSPPPKLVLIRFAGTFVEVAGHLGDPEAALPVLEKLGADGAFVRNGMGTIAQTAIWKRSAVLGWEQPGPHPALSGRSR